MSDARFNETFDKLCENSQTIMEAALNEIEADPEASVVICMGVYAHPEMTDRDCRNRDPQYFFCWKGDEPTDDAKEELRERCSDAVCEYTESDCTDASSAMVFPIEDDYDFYFLAVFAATDDPNKSIEESCLADTILDEINESVKSIALSLPEEEEYLDSEDPEEQDDCMYDISDAGCVRVYGGAYYGQLIASD